jgi:hypothetical protein
MIHFKPITEFEPGQIVELLKSSYQGLIKCFPAEKTKLYHQWALEDEESFGNLDTIGRSLLFTCYEDKVIGFFGWDDRYFPHGLVGHNCILPDYQNKQYHF